MSRRPAALALGVLLLASMPAALAVELAAPAHMPTPAPALPTSVAAQLRGIPEPAAPLPAVPTLTLVGAVQAWDARMGVTRDGGALDVLATLDPALAAPVAHLLSALLVAAELRDEAFAAVAAEELLPLTLGASEDPAGLEIAARVDHARMATAAHVMARAVDAALPALTDYRDALAALPLPALPMGAPVEPLVNLPPVLVMDPLLQDTFYGKDAALAIDLGGRDTYDMNAGGGLIAQGPVGDPSTYQHNVLGHAIGGEFEDAFMMYTAALALDLGGDDQYGVYKSVWSGSRDRFCTQGPYIRRVVVQGAGSGGLGMLVDVAGNDRYDAKTLAQGEGHIAGVGVLVDMAGHDAYTAIRAAMGNGILVGSGVFADLDGNDAYTFTSPPGGILNVDTGRCDATRRLGLGSAVQQATGHFLDAAGDDTYRVDSQAFGHNLGGFHAAFVDAAGEDDYGGYPGVGNGMQRGDSFGQFLDL